MPGRSFWSFWGLVLDTAPNLRYNTHMDEDFNYEGAEGSDIDAWEAEQVFQDHEGQDEIY